MDSHPTMAVRFEQYTRQNPTEVLLIRVTQNGQADEILVFKGFSSSLMHPTSFDPDCPVLLATAEIHQIDRLRGPFQPGQPDYIQQGLRLDEFEELLRAINL